MVECAICLAGLFDELVALQCGHVFHKPCVGTLRIQGGGKAKCPLCRTIIKGVLPIFYKPSIAGDEKEEERDSMGEIRTIANSLTNTTLTIELPPMLNLDPQQEINQLREQSELSRQEIIALEAELDDRETEREQLELEHENAIASLQQVLADQRVEDQKRKDFFERTRQKAQERILKLENQNSNQIKALESLQQTCLLQEKELCNLRTIRLTREMERILTEFNEFEVGERFERFKERSHEDLCVELALLTIKSRGQEQDLNKLNDELRISKVNFETVKRQLQKARETTTTQVTAIDHLAGLIKSPKRKQSLALFEKEEGEKMFGNGKKRSLLDLDRDNDNNTAPRYHQNLPSQQQQQQQQQQQPKPLPLMAMTGPSVPPPFKFGSPTRWQSNAPDGRGGYKRVSNLSNSSLHNRLQS